VHFKHNKVQKNAKHWGGGTHVLLFLHQTPDTETMMYTNQNKSQTMKQPQIITSFKKTNCKIEKKFQVDEPQCIAIKRNDKS
jgi:hypothetical protein